MISYFKRQRFTFSLTTLACVWAFFRINFPSQTFCWITEYVDWNEHIQITNEMMVNPFFWFIMSSIFALLDFVIALEYECNKCSNNDFDLIDVESKPFVHLRCASPDNRCSNLIALIIHFLSNSYIMGVAFIWNQFCMCSPPEISSKQFYILIALVPVLIIRWTLLIFPVLNNSTLPKYHQKLIQDI